MGMKTILKRLVGAFGDAAKKELARKPDAYRNLATTDPSRLDQTRVNSLNADTTTLPAGGLIGAASDDD